MSGRFVVVNNSSAPVYAFVSKYSYAQGSDAWYSIPAGAADVWARDNWELIAFTIGDDNRAGVYVKVNKTVIYNSISDLVIVN
ncbi:hypothetical protein C8Q70DRAFT_1027673 [Cubamyces menziesii]|uniref:Uncharacterized protein n=1 Tax=Trametes cubensis TaxID=1111947 RepID=A0AAD7XA15_9APHY|nr:hypothetical protein C8Q70DRAFT_1027673 [Cubamyces menziesii]KAJ8469103.1 hypothetical protein ONZ51_g9203 [Trametes cubensis]